MRSNANRIPDHSQAALAEAYEAALICAAFRKMEDDEMKCMNQPLPDGAPRRTLPGRALHSMHLRRARRLFTRTLPRAAQFAACLIAVVAIGAGAALAASSEARHWAANILTGSRPDDNPFFSGWQEDADAGFVDGAFADDRLFLFDLNSAVLRVLYDSSGEPEVYNWTAQRFGDIQYLASMMDEVYLLGETGRDESQPEGLRFTLGRLVLSDDGGCSAEPLAEIPASALFDPLGRRASSCGMSGAAAGDGRLYFTTHCEVPVEGQWFGEMADRLFAYDLATGALCEINLPDASADAPQHPYLFNGRDGHAFLMIEDSGAQVSRILQIEPDGSLTPVAAIPALENRYASCPAYRESDDALCYLLNGGVWIAPDCSPERAHLAASAVETGVRGLTVGDNSYLLVSRQRARVFDLDDAPDEIAGLVVNGDSRSRRLTQSFVENHPDVTVISGNSAPFGGDLSGIPIGAPTNTDIWCLFGDSFEVFRNAGFARPLNDPDILDAVRQMLPGLQRRAMIGNSVSAVPMDFIVYADVAIDRATWAALGYAPEQLPETWLELLTLLRDRSLSDESRDLPIAGGVSAANASDFAASLYLQIVRSFIGACDAQGLPVDFASDDFRAVMNRFREIDFNAFAYDDAVGLPGCLFFIGTYDFSPMTMRDSIENLVLRFSDDAPRVASASGTFACIDPNSSRYDLAQEYLEEMIPLYTDEQRRAMTGCAMRGDDAETTALVDAYRRIFDDVSFRPLTVDGETLEAFAACAMPYLTGELSFDALAAAMNECFCE